MPHNITMCCVSGAALSHPKSKDASLLKCEEKQKNDDEEQE